MGRVWRFACALMGFVVLSCIAPVPTYASACFQSAPSDMTIEHLFNAAPLPLLTEGQANETRNIMAAMRGKWAGTAKGYWCAGTVDRPQTLPDNYTVDADISIGGRTVNQLKLVASMHSEQDNGTHTETLALFVVGSQLYVDTPDQADDTHMQERSIAPGHITFAQMAYPPASGRVIVRTIDVHGDSMGIGVEVYTRDILTSVSTWHLSRMR